MRRIIILEERVGSRISYRYLMWAAVPAARQSFYAKPATWESAFSARTQEEIDDLRAGEVVEKVDTFASDQQLTLAEVRAELVAAWTAFQDHVDNHNPWNRYGSFWDGSTWTAAGAS